MRILRGTRHAPLLLGALVVLATTALAFAVALLVHQRHARAIEALQARPALLATSLSAELQRRFDEAVANHARRPPFQFARYILAPLRDGVPVDWVESPLIRAVEEDGVEAFFGQEYLNFKSEASAPSFFVARVEPAVTPARRVALEAAALRLTVDWIETEARDRLLGAGPVRREAIGIPDLAAFRAEIRGTDTNEVISELEVVRASEGAAFLRGRQTPVRRGRVVREVVPADDGGWVLSARWQTLIDDPTKDDELASRLRRSFRSVGDEGLELLQGVLLDLDWWTGPSAVAGLIDLEEGEAIAFGARESTADRIDADVDLLAALGVERPRDLPAGLGLARAEIDLAPHLSRQRRDWFVFGGGVAVVIALLGAVAVAATRRLQGDLRRAERTGEFVASVTHELRTPISTIALHTEMLLDGWIEDPEQRTEYYRRIDTETARLARLVERILEQSRLTRGRAEAPAVEPEVADLSEAVRRLAPSLEAGAPTGFADLRFELDDDLPAVLLTDEAIESVVTNLVENARKYAPADPSRGPDGQIVVTTRSAGGATLLEVSDRGPGIPPGEHRRVFEAFYRVGTEATRTTTGTGLGLHLVQLQVTALGGRVEALDREGGGATLQVVFPPV